MTDFVDNRTQKVILIGQYSLWAEVEAGVPQGSIHGPLLFLIYINNLSENLVSNPKLFDDDTSFFSVVKHADASNIDLNNHLKKLGEWIFQRKMNFNSDPTKEAREPLFSCKGQMINYPSFGGSSKEVYALSHHLGNQGWHSMAKY